MNMVKIEICLSVTRGQVIAWFIGITFLVGLSLGIMQNGKSLLVNHQPHHTGGNKLNSAYQPLLFNMPLVVFEIQLKINGIWVFFIWKNTDLAVI